MVIFIRFVDGRRRKAAKKKMGIKKEKKYDDMDTTYYIILFVWSSESHKLAALVKMRNKRHWIHHENPNP